jgi:ParB family chromosome partitioning protein
MMAKKRGLGRGLDALLKPQEGTYRRLPLDLLQPNSMQPRAQFEEEALEELAASIRAQGVVQPIVVTADSGEKFTIVAGERRWRAARRAGLKEVPVVVREVAGDEELLEMALVENLQRADLNPLEEAEAYKALQERFELSQGEIGRKVGKSRAAVSNTLRLLRLAPEIREMLSDGRLTAGQARPLLALGEAEQVRLAKKAAGGGLSARQVEDRASKRGATPAKKSAGRSADANTQAAAEDLTRRLQTKVEIRRSGRGGRLLLHFHGEEELMRLYDLLMKAGGAK